jgi:two-component system sensor histidine kinase HydH
MPDGGKITVESQVGRNGWEIMFADNGMGISEEVLPKLFLPLFTTKAKGMGFGLAICKRIVEAHGGSIAVSSTKGVGTTFTLNLPFEPKIEAGGENLWISVPEF